MLKDGLIPQCHQKQFEVQTIVFCNLVCHIINIIIKKTCYIYNGTTRIDCANAIHI